ncbi:kinase domain protein [Ceratobasidium sp. AG-Ba]|nr:kinase domain protein [Ceratobasidium sp. AG-Ba]
MDGEWTTPRIHLEESYSGSLQLVHPNSNRPGVLTLVWNSGIKVHGDLKGTNILVSDSGVLKLTDFGNAEMKQWFTIKFTETNGAPTYSLRWAAPEIVNGGVHKKESDMYALGMTFLETVTGRVPFSGKSDVALLCTIVMQKVTLQRPEELDAMDAQEAQVLWEMISNCCAHDPFHRPIAARVYLSLKYPRKFGFGSIPVAGPLAGHKGVQTEVENTDIEAHAEVTNANIGAQTEVVNADMEAQAEFANTPFQESSYGLTWDDSNKHVSNLRPDTRHLFHSEIYPKIVGLYVASVASMFSIRKYRSPNSSPSQKSELVPLMLVSQAIGKLVLHKWGCCWPGSKSPPGSRWALVCPLFSLPVFQQPEALLHLTWLRFVSLDFTNAFEYRDSGWHCMSLVHSFPPSLEEIELLGVHASGIEVILLVAQFCPNVTALRVEFCTTFNNPACAWWAGHQRDNDHSHYMIGHQIGEVNAYAEKVAFALRNLHNLEYVHLGVYFTMFWATVYHRSAFNHIKYHPIQDSKRWLDRLDLQDPHDFEAAWMSQHPNVPPPNIRLPCLADRSLWQTICPPCIDRWGTPVERAERLAASVLAVNCPWLKTISFASFVAEGRVKPSEWEVRQSGPTFPSEDMKDLGRAEYPEGTRVQVYTKRPETSDEFSEHLVFWWSDDGPVCVD